MVRCPACGARESEWAARCERCGADLDAATEEPDPARLPSAGPSVDTRRRGARVAAVAAALAVLVAAGAFAAGREDDRAVPGGSSRAATTTGAPGGAPVRAPITVVVIEPSGDLVAHGLADGSTHHLASDVGGWPLGPRTVGGRLLYVTAGRILDIDGGVVASGSMLIPVVGSAAFWTTPEFGTNSDAVRWSMEDAGRGIQLAGFVPLASDELPVAAAGDLLVTVRAAGATVHDGGGTAPPLAAVTHRDQILGLTTDRLAYVAPCEPNRPRCLHVVDPRTGNQVLAARDPGGGFAMGGAMAPDGSGRIAAFGVDPMPGYGEGPALYPLLVDPSGAVDIIGPKLVVGEPVGAAAWDPTGRWLVYGGLKRTHLYDSKTGELRLLPFYAGYGFVVASPEFGATGRGATVGGHAP